jgi:hypothetical protein
MAEDQDVARATTPLPYNPQVFFWIAEYIDGSIVSQFDLDDGQEILYKTVDQSRLRSLGWYPVTPKLASLVKDQVLRVVPFLPHYRVMLGPNRRPICHRQQHLHLVEAYLCLKCGCRWLVDDKPNMLGLSYSRKIVEAVDQAGSRYRSPVCPFCEAFTVYVCPNCKTSRSRPFMKPADPWICLECGQDLPDQTTLISFEERHTFYVLGYEEAGQKHTMRIDENGKVEMG